MRRSDSEVFGLWAGEPDVRKLVEERPDPIPLSGRNVALRPIGQGDYEFLRTQELSENLGPRWRFRGTTPAPELYPQSLWQGVVAQFAIVDRRSPVPLGLVALYNADTHHDTAYFAVADFHPEESSIKVLQGAVLFFSYVFGTWDYRKLYAEAFEFNLPQFGRLRDRVLVEEGRLRDHYYYAGRLWDLVILALYRDIWNKWEALVLPSVLGRRSGAST
jgi:hypothetical protein